MEFVPFVGLFIFIILWLVHVEMFFRRLKQLSPNTYEGLGSPSVIGKRSSGLPALRFILLREYRQLNDESFTQMGNRIVVHFITTILLFLSFFYFIGQFRA